MSAALALRTAIRARLAADADLAALLGGPKVFDEVPAGTVPPYVVLAEIETRTAGTGSDSAEDHRLVLDVWSEQGGMAEALAAAERVIALLDDAALAPAGHTLVNLRWTATEARRTADGRYRYASLRFRVLTEPAG